MMRIGFVLFVFGASLALAVEPSAASEPGLPVSLEDPAWQDLVRAFARRPASAVSDFEERRWFSFRKTPTVLHGEARVSVEHGLSLHYPGTRPRTVIIDERGMLVREGGRDNVPPPDARATATHAALLHLLRFDLQALAEIFEVHGSREGDAWTLGLVPRMENVRRTLGQIAVAGEKTTVRRIEFRRSPTQRVEILIAPPRDAGVPFTADELKRFFR